MEKVLADEVSFQLLARKKNDDRGQKIVYNFVHETISYAKMGEETRDGARQSEIKIIESNILQFLIGVC